MKKTVLFSLAILSIFSVLLAAPQAAYACSCMAAGSPKESLEQSAAVFIGTVESVGEPQDGSRFVLFDVRNAWKGVATSNIAVTTPQDSAMCGFNFEQGKSYVVYASQDESGVLSVNLCSRTHELAENDEDIAALGAAMPTTAVEVPNAKRPLSEKTKTAALAIIALVAVLSVGAMIRRKQRMNQ
jgi:hypothetical protein